MVFQKYMYVILFEIIYMMFLNRWNLFNFEYKGLEREVYGKIVF